MLHQRLLPFFQLVALLAGRAVAFAPIRSTPRSVASPALRLSEAAVAPIAARNDNDIDSEVSLPAYPNLVPSSFGGIDYYSIGSSNSNSKDDEKRVYRTIFVLGGPGSGKGTQSSLVLDNYSSPGRYVCHLSAGDLLREARAAGGEEAELIESYIVAGKIVPVEVTLGLLKRAMDQICDQSVKGTPPIFLVDGFPRSDDNLDGWEDIMGSHSALVATVVYDCPEEELEKRLLERAKTSGRSDDNLDSIRKRFNTFKTETEPVVYRLELSKRCPVVHIDANRPVEEVWADTQSIFDNVVISDVLSANSNLLESEGCLIEGADVRLLEGGKRAEVTYETTDAEKGRVTEKREWAFNERDEGWTCVGVERAPKLVV